MGPWSFVSPRFANIAGCKVSILTTAALVPSTFYVSVLLICNFLVFVFLLPVLLFTNKSILCLMYDCLFIVLFSFQLRYSGRGVLGVPAVGMSKLHQAEVKQLMEDAFR